MYNHSSEAALLFLVLLCPALLCFLFISGNLSLPPPRKRGVQEVNPSQFKLPLAPGFLSKGLTLALKRELLRELCGAFHVPHQAADPAMARGSRSPWCHLPPAAFSAVGGI